MQRWLVAGLALAALLAGAPTAWARADARFDALGLDPPADGFGYIGLGGAKALAPGSFSAGTTFFWAHRPLRLGEPRGGEAGDRVTDDFYVLDVAAAAGILKAGRARLEAGLVLPLVLYELGYELERPDERTRNTGVGDLRTDLKLALLDRDDDRVGLSLRGWGRFPIDGNVDFASNERIAAGFESEIEYHPGFLRVGLTLGYEWLDGDVHAGGITWDDRVLLGFGLGIAPFSDLRGFEPLELIFELRHSFRAGNPYARAEEAPIEAGGGLRWTGERVYGLLAGSGGLNRGAGAPDARVSVAVGVNF
jgi:hypothetical protein